MKNFIKKILFPHYVMVLVMIPFSVIGLLYAFLHEKPMELIVYFSYAFSAYNLTVVCTTFPKLWKRIKGIRYSNKYIKRYFEDVQFRLKISLWGSFGVNMIYALLQLFMGIKNASSWFYALSAYYMLLTFMRYFLLKEIHKNRLGKNRFFELLHYRLCGILLVLMNTALAVMVFYMVRENKGFKYHYIMTIAMAAYTFYTMTMAIIGIIKYKKYNNPILSAVKTVSFTAALVSMLSLETAMLAAFGENESEEFRLIITGITGATVCVAVLLYGIYITVTSTKEISILKKSEKIQSEK